MTYRWEITAHALRQGIVGIVRTHDAESAVEAARAVIEAGLRSVELPLTNPGALDAISGLSAAYPDATIGSRHGARRGVGGPGHPQPARGSWCRRRWTPR